MILITGAGGKTGKAVISAAAAQGEAVRAFARHVDQARSLNMIGAQKVFIGDLRDEAALREAMENVRAVYYICPNVHPDEVILAQTAIAAARAAGVAHFVYHSVLHPHTSTMSHHWKKLRVEELLFQSGLPFTILQPTAYMQNILAGWNNIVEAGLYTVPYSAETRLSLIDLDDVAAAAANVLTELGHTRAIYELVGTRALAQTEIAETLSLKLRRPVQVKTEQVDQWEKRARANGLGDYQIETLTQMFHYYEQFGMWGNSNVLGWLIRRPATTFPAFVERVMQAGLIAGEPAIGEV